MYSPSATAHAVGQKIAVENQFSPLPHVSWEETQVTKLGRKHLYLMCHLPAPLTALKKNPTISWVKEYRE